MTVIEPSVQRKTKSPGRKPRKAGGAQVASVTVVHEATAAETPEQRRARLMAELAELNRQEPQKAAGPIGPNYWAMNHNTLKTLCISKSIIDRTGTQEGMVIAMQNDDLRQGLQPHPRENENAMKGIRSGNTPVHAEPHTRDAIRIIDTEGNQYAMVYRIARMIGGNPILADMDGNARKIVAALNEGRFS